MARPGGLRVQRDRTLVNSVLKYILAWIGKHMDPNCVEDAIGFEQGRPALHFESIEVIDGRHVSCQLKKEPLGNVLKEVKFFWLPHKDGKIPQLAVHTSYPRMLVRSGVTYRGSLETIRGGKMWHGDSETFTDIPRSREYFVSLQIPSL